MFAREGHPGEVTWTSDLATGVAGANVVLIQLRVGGQQARRVDETLPLACGCIGQETTGVGGLAKALRTVPVVLDVAERIRRHAAPDAWIVDFTNPVGIVTRALLDAGTARSDCATWPSASSGGSQPTSASSLPGFGSITSASTT
jgi:6-phospho-beta-glucosidase